jgi:hypothetical protein
MIRWQHLWPTHQALTHIPISSTYTPCEPTLPVHFSAFHVLNRQWNGWSGTVMSKMYILMDTTPYHLKVVPKTDVSDFHAVFEADGTTLIPYIHKETISMSRKFGRNKIYYKTWINIYRAIINTFFRYQGRYFYITQLTLSPTHLSPHGSVGLLGYEPLYIATVISRLRQCFPLFFFGHHTTISFWWSGLGISGTHVLGHWLVLPYYGSWVVIFMSVASVSHSCLFWHLWT